MFEKRRQRWNDRQCRQNAAIQGLDEQRCILPLVRGRDHHKETQGADEGAGVRMSTSYENGRRHGVYPLHPCGVGGSWAVHVVRTLHGWHFFLRNPGLGPVHDQLESRDITRPRTRTGKPPASYIKFRFCGDRNRGSYNVSEEEQGSSDSSI